MSVESINNKIDLVIGYKADIKTALQEQDSSISDSTLLAEYADKIRAMTLVEGDTETAVTSLRNQVDTLTSDKEQLNVQINTLNEEKTRLEGQVNTLTAEKEELQALIDTLSASGDEKDAQILTLTTEKENLTTQVNDLSAQVSSLNSDLDLINSDTVAILGEG